MKTGAALLLSTFLAALCGSLVDANGVCYDPNHVGDGKNAASVAQDIATIKSKGFTYVRTYISKFGHTDMVKQLAASGLQVVAGVPYPAGEYAEQLNAAIEAAKNGNVINIMIGNENLAGASSVPDAMIQEIRRVKGLVPSGVKVGTVQRNTEFLNNIGKLSELIDACDVIGVNIHPYFTPGQNGASNAIETTKTHWNKALALAGDKLILGETGWPSEGVFNGNAGTPASASAYFGQYKTWSAALPAHKKFYFQMFDQPYKPESFEKTYGILGADSSDKFGASVPVTTSAPATSAPVVTSSAPAPTTAAPTATPKPTATPAAGNSTTPSSGSLDKASKTAGLSLGSAAGSLADAGGIEKVSSSSKVTLTSDSETGGEAAATAAGTSARTSVDTPVVEGKDNTAYAGGKSDTTEANTRASESSSGDAATVAFAVVAGCMAVVAAFGFIYRTRKKAAELEAAESKPSFAMTPHGGCVL